MASVNKVILLGSVGSVEVKEKLVQISLATSSGYKKKDSDEWVNKTEWHRLIFAIPNLVERAKFIGKETLYMLRVVLTLTHGQQKKERKKTLRR